MGGGESPRTPGSPVASAPCQAAGPRGASRLLTWEGGGCEAWGAGGAPWHPPQTYDKARLPASVSPAAQPRGDATVGTGPGQRCRAVSQRVVGFAGDVGAERGSGGLRGGAHASHRPRKRQEQLTWPQGRRWASYPGPGNVMGGGLEGKKLAPPRSPLTSGSSALILSPPPPRERMVCPQPVPCPLSPHLAVSSRRPAPPDSSGAGHRVPSGCPRAWPGGGGAAGCRVPGCFLFCLLPLSSGNHGASPPPPAPQIL